MYCCHMYHKLIVHDYKIEGIWLDGTDFSFLLLFGRKGFVLMHFFPLFFYMLIFCGELECMLTLVILVLVILVTFELLWLLMSVICNEKTDWLVCLKGFFGFICTL